MSAQTLLSGGDKWFSYSGSVFGDVSAPATIQLNFIPNTGLRDSYVQIQPFYGDPIIGTANTALGIEVKLNDVTIIKQQSDRYAYGNESTVPNAFVLFIPRQSKLEVISLNRTDNNTQERGCNILGYYL
jgi:hypothetical protein